MSRPFVIGGVYRLLRGGDAAGPVRRRLVGTQTKVQPRWDPRTHTERLVRVEFASTVRLGGEKSGLRETSWALGPFLESHALEERP